MYHAYLLCTRLYGKQLCILINLEVNLDNSVKLLNHNSNIQKALKTELPVNFLVADPNLTEIM